MSCGNHFVPTEDSNQADIYTLINENFDKAMAEAFGAHRSITEFSWDQMDECQLKIREEQAIRKEESSIVRQRENAEASLF